MSTSFSIVVCCYNSERTIKQCILHIISAIHFAKERKIEIILVDNNCVDSTFSLAKDTIKGSGLENKFKIIKEPKPGLMNARKRGILSAQNEYILFIDDDNFIFENFIVELEKIINLNPNFGAIGSKSFFLPTEKNYTNINYGFDIQKYRKSFAIGSVVDATILQDNVDYIWGACSTFKAKPIKKIFSTNKVKIKCVGRKGKIQMGGDDSELCALIKLLGFKIAFSPKLLSFHAVDEARLSKKNYSKTIKGFKLSHKYLRGYNAFLYLFGGKNVKKSFLRYLKGFIGIFIYTPFVLSNIIALRTELKHFKSEE